jgi:hypothetical protein
MDFIGVLIGDEPVMKSNISYYQRLLAMDQVEAAEIVEEHLKIHPVEQIYDDVLLPALSYAKRDCELGRLTENDQQFVFQATREILDDLDTLKPVISSQLLDSAGAATIDKKTSPKVRIIGCPARDEADELALLMFRQLLDSTRYDIELMADETLASEVVSLTAEKRPALICIASLPPGGLAQARYLCKRLRAHLPGLKIIVGRWGRESEDDSNVLLSAGADKVGATMIETRGQITQLIQSSPHFESESAPTIAPFPHDERRAAEIFP